MTKPTTENRTAYRTINENRFHWNKKHYRAWNNTRVIEQEKDIAMSAETYFSFHRTCSKQRLIVARPTNC